MKKLMVAVSVLVLFLMAVPVYAQVLTEDDGRCAAGLMVGHGGHEWGHQLSGYKHDGKSWAPPLSLWGNQWDESQRNYQAIALGGFAGGHIFAALNATMADDPYGQCTVHADTFTSFFYAARAKLLPDHSGDYDPFSVSKRREITRINIGASLFLEGMTARIYEDMRWLSSRPPLFDFNAEFYGN